MDFLVTVKKGQIEKAYEITTETYYAAKTEGVKRFLDDYKIPGKPWTYLTRKGKTLMSVSVISKKLPKVEVPTPTNKFYQEKTADFRKLVREGPLEEEIKVEATGLLLKLQEVFNGQLNSST